MKVKLRKVSLSNLYEFTGPILMGLVIVERENVNVALYKSVFKKLYEPADDEAKEWWKKIFGEER